MPWQEDHWFRAICSDCEFTSLPDESCWGRGDPTDVMGVSMLLWTVLYPSSLWPRCPPIRSLYSGLVVAVVVDVEYCAHSRQDQQVNSGKDPR